MVNRARVENLDALNKTLNNTSDKTRRLFFLNMTNMCSANNEPTYSEHIKKRKKERQFVPPQVDTLTAFRTKRSELQAKKKQREAKLKGSIGEGSNHSNFSHQSSVKFCQNSVYFDIFCQKIKRKIRIFNIFENICEIPTNFHQTELL